MIIYRKTKPSLLPKRKRLLPTRRAKKANPSSLPSHSYSLTSSPGKPKPILTHSSLRSRPSNKMDSYGKKNTRRTPLPTVSTSSLLVALLKMLRSPPTTSLKELKDLKRMCSQLILLFSANSEIKLHTHSMPPPISIKYIFAS
jgi:hypothetical protein